MPGICIDSRQISSRPIIGSLFKLLITQLCVFRQLVDVGFPMPFYLGTFLRINLIVGVTTLGQRHNICKDFTEQTITKHFRIQNHNAFFNISLFC